MHVKLKVETLTPEQVRTVAALLSRNQGDVSILTGDNFAPYWAPVVHCEGPSHFTIYTPRITAGLAARITQALADSVV